MSVCLLILCLASLQRGGGARPEAPGCSDPEALRVAEEALEQVNRDRTSGYVLSLNRLYDLARGADQVNDGSLYKLTIDVLETKCHVTSRKPWKQCQVRDISEVPVYGECEVSAHAHAQVKLQSYSCVLREVPDLAIVRECPDCPTADSLGDPIVMETAKLSLQRFNEESRLANHFALENITKASYQWVVGPSYFVEFTIVETVCSRTTDASELSGCAPMDCQFAHRGLCRGSHMSADEEFDFKPLAGKRMMNRKAVDVTCEIFEPQDAAEEEVRAKASGDSRHAGHQHHNHTHLHPHEHSAAPGPVAAAAKPLGTVVDKPASPRSAPAAGSCPGPRRHNLGLSDIKL
ncbi:fetuin-B [Scophthalmus maximus]|uniref:fetuin-B n=1 Tax=Scophthalmus maximus TaxID=52904 RepID=UPI001FA8D154|nr:fetuin-B [Scophthalmus maximus]